MKTQTKPTAKQLLSRALWLAFQASAPMGLGFFQTGIASALTEEKLFETCKPSEGSDGTLRISTDYVAGRMMKTSFIVDAKGELSISPAVPRHDYQSWAGSYSTAAELLAAVDQSFA